MGTELATAYIALVPTTRGIAGQLETQIVGPASAAGDKAGKNLGSGIASGSKGGILTAKNALTGLGVVGAIAAVKSVQGFSSAAKEVMQLKRQVGGTTEEMSRLRFAAQQSGVSTQTLGRAFVLLSKNGDAGKLDAFGVSLKNADRSAKPLTAQLSTLADAYNNAGNASDRNRLLVAAFGRGGAEMGKLLGKGADGIAQLEKEADKLGVTLTDKNLKAMSDNLAATRKFSASVQGLEIQLGQGLLPIVTEGATVLTKLTTAFSGQPEILRQIEIGSLAAAVGYSKLLKPVIGLAGKANTLLAGIGGGGEDAGVAAASAKAAAAKSASAAASAELATAQQAAAATGGEEAASQVAVTEASSTAAAAIEAETVALAELSAAEGTAAAAGGGMSLSLGSVATGAGALLGPLAAVMAVHQRGTAEGKKYADALIEGQAPLEALATLQKAVFEPGQSLEHWKGIETDLKAQSAALLATGTSAEIYTAAQQHLFEGTPEWKVHAAAVLADQRALLATIPAVKAAQDAANGVTPATNKWTAATLGAAAAQARLSATTKSATDTVLDGASKANAYASAASALDKANQDYTANAATAAGKGQVIADLRKQAADTAQQDADAVRSAEQSVAQAYQQRTTAIAALSAAEKTLSTDTAHNVQLVKDMATAIDAAKESLVQLKRSASRDKVSVNEAGIRLDEAKQAAAQGPLDPTDKFGQLRLDDALQTAKLDYADAVDRAAASTKELSKGDAAYIAQSPQVQAVQDAIKENAAKIATDQDAVATANKGVADSNDAIGVAAAAAAVAVGKARDDQVTAYGNIRDAIDEAKGKSGELALAVQADGITLITAAKDAGVPVTAIATGLQNVLTNMLPPVASGIDDLLAKFIVATPLSAGAAAFRGKSGHTVNVNGNVVVQMPAKSTRDQANEFADLLLAGF